MKAKKLIIVSVITMVTFTMCKKEKATSSPSNTNLAQAHNTSIQPFQQKMYIVSQEQTMKAIKKFKYVNENRKQQSSQLKLIDADSLTVDSAIWVLEATLNSDFDVLDSTTANRETVVREFDRSVTKNGSKLSSEDLETAYTELTSDINGSLDGTNRIKIIDIIAIVSGNNVTLRASSVSYFVSHYAFCIPCSFNCDPGDALCTSVDGSYQLQVGLNSCHFDIPYWCYRQFYTNVQTLNFNNSSNGYSTSLYYKSGYFPIGNCDNSVISSSTINSFVTNCATLANNNKPTASHRPTNALAFWLGTTASATSFNLTSSFWQVNVMYGVPFYTNC